MKVTFAESFWESLRTLRRHQTWWYKIYELFRYKLPLLFKNIWYFRKELWDFRGWDYTFNLQLFARSLAKTAEVLKDGNEIDKTRLKKVEKIQRVIYLIERIKTENYISDAENELGKLKNISSWFKDDDSPEEKEHNRKVFERSSEIEQQEWNELWTILRGQNIQEYKDLMDSLSDEKKENTDVWGDWFDGSDMRGWWD